MRCSSTDGTVEPSAGLSSSLVLKRRGLLSTDKLTRAKYQAIMTTFCTGERTLNLSRIHQMGGELACCG